MGSKAYIVVKVNWEGLHYWKEAPLVVNFLSKPHRHIFYAEAKIPVMHNDRQLEFFMVKDFLQRQIKDMYPDTQMGGVSCEMIAEVLIKRISDNYGIKRGIVVSVFEDMENGAVVEQ